MAYRRRDGTEKVDLRAEIQRAVLDLLSRQGISGVSMRAVAREAGVALGLLHYHYDDKAAPIADALRHVEALDLTVVEPDPALPPEGRVVSELRRVADPEFLTTDYLALHLQLWALARAHQEFGEINTHARQRYCEGLAALIAAARPGPSQAECDHRAADIDVLQNGLWLTSLLGLDASAVERSVQRTIEVALAA